MCAVYSLLALSYFAAFMQVYSLEVPHKYFDQHHLKCIDDLKVDKQIVGKNLDDKFRLPKDDEDLNKFFVCACTAKGVFDEDGAFIKDSLKEDVLNIIIPLMGKQSSNDSELADKVLEECKNTQNPELAHRLIDLFNCIVDAIHNFTK